MMKLSRWRQKIIYQIAMRTKLLNAVKEIKNALALKQQQGQVIVRSDIIL